jgi:hypothetical protein
MSMYVITIIALAVFRDKSIYHNHENVYYWEETMINYGSQH